MPNDLTTTDNQPLTINEDVQLPAWAADLEPTGTEELGQFVRTPRLRVMQSQTDRVLVDQHGEGSPVIMPDGVKVAEYQHPFDVVTVAFWPTWAKVGDVNDTESDFIMLESWDADSELARRAKSPSLREESYGAGNKYTAKYQEHLNFAVIIDSGPATGMPCLINFSSGSWQTGSTLSGYLRRRQCPLYINRVKFVTEPRSNKRNQSWFDLAFGTADPAFVPQERVESLATLHGEFMDNVTMMREAAKAEQQVDVEG